MAKKKGGFNKLRNFEKSSLLASSQSYMGLLYGALTIIVIFVIIFLGIKTISQRGAQISEEAGKTEETMRMYEVKEGDNLWTIAEREYKDGYKWAEVAKANNLKDPDVIEKGMKLTLPVIVAKESVESAKTGAQPDEKITGNSYKVVEGDSLWTVAVRAYGDGFKWVEIAKANNLVNPDLIHSGNRFDLPR